MSEEKSTPHERPALALKNILEFSPGTALSVFDDVKEVMGILAQDAPYLQSLAYFGFSREGEFVVSGDDALLHPAVLERLVHVLKRKIEEKGREEHNVYE